MTNEWEEFTPPHWNAGKWVQRQLRFPSQEMLEQMKKLAKEDNQSLNSEIMQALQEFIERRGKEQEDDHYSNS